MDQARPQCKVCGFDPTDYDEQDALGTLRSFVARWRWTLEGFDPETARASVALPGTDRLLGGAAKLPEPPASWIPSGSDAVDGFEGSVLEAVHDGTHRLVLAGRYRAAHEAVTRSRAAVPPTVKVINMGRGGAPKQPVERAVIGRRGLEGDRQAARRHHGRVWQAVSLWSTEVIATLAAEGHPVGAGCAAENLTVAGLPWEALRPGMRLGVGPEVVVELTAYAEPCQKIAPCFADRDFSRVNHDRHPGVSRIYASVLHPGQVTIGDVVAIEPVVEPAVRHP